MLLSGIKGIGKKKGSYLTKLGIFNKADLLTHFPKRYEDRRICRSFNDVLNNQEEKYPVEVKVLGYDTINAKGKSILKIIISDGFLRASLICFNRDYLRQLLEEGKEYIIFGDFQYKYGELQAGSFEFIPKGAASDSLNFLRIVPIYPLTEGINQNFLRQIIDQILSTTNFAESLPLSLIKKHDFVSKKEAFSQIHFPDDYQSLQKAIDRLKYYELFELEINVALKRFFFTHQKKKTYANKNETTSSLLSQFIKNLPFELTKGQKKAFEDIKKDLLSKIPMHRMIQGDVGSGKTVVAALSMLVAVENGYQTAIMVPTEVLAKQHYKTLNNFFNPLSIKVDLLTGGLKTSERKHILDRIREGLAQMIVGTQALISDDVEYHDLSLVIIDEQHKFGVQERVKLVEKGEGVDILVMTATPIPRTLSLTAYGDLDISIIPDKPKRSVHVHSKCIFTNDKRIQMYQFIDKEIENGRQGFIVCPLIDESDKLQISSTMAIFDEIKNDRLPHRKVSVLHGRFSSEEKEHIMTAFLEGEFDILISTSVIEVGVDVSNASFMVVENADRFGLSQLHQLRGRIGRGEYDSYCFFTIPNHLTDDGKSRLKALMTHSDGFALAEEDLKIRGPGEFLGTRQSGIDNLKLANLIDDEAILLKAKNDAFQLVSDDPHFKKQENQVLEKSIGKRFSEKYLFYITN